MTRQHVDILLVEDNPADVELTRQGLLKAQIANNLHVVDHGGNAIAFLRREGPYSDAPRPHLILLDLCMPHVDGRDVLKHVKRSDDLCDIPVVVLSSLGEPEDIQEGYRLKANAYMKKPPSFQQFVELVSSMGKYWFSLVQHPPSEFTTGSEPRHANQTQQVESELA